MAIFSWFRKFLNGTTTVLFRCVLRAFSLVFFMVPPRKQINPSMPSSSSSSVDSTPFSSSPPSSSSSSSQSLKHDVFLSFRGTDIRNTFVDHLYSALVQQGIDTYKDDKTLPRGETIGPSLLNAIEASQIAVIVFSENYADSSWCLQELAHIMKCKDERGLIVIPIFYNVDPSEIRKQKGKYGEALRKHELENKNVEFWRKALVDAGNLSGDVANGPETMFIKQIVDTISNRLCPTLLSDDEDLIGIEARLQALKSKMELESDGVLMVGIWGLGGGGKTTLASALYDEISTNFDGSCFIKDVREESSKHGLVKLQEKILSHILKLKTDEIVGDVGRLMKSRFHSKKVLIVLDDVDHADQLKTLAGSNAWFGKGSRIIITTRDEHLLNSHKVNVIHNISLLNDREAIQVFRKHAPQKNRPIKDYEMLSEKVVSYVGGLPLALKVLGSFLFDKDMSEWKSALDRLEDIPEGDIVERLKISYDGLKPTEKELFLDIACHFRGYGKGYAMEIFDACGFHPVIGVKVLIQKALITVPKEGIFDMHDLIQEMASYIVRGENPKNLELHSRVWKGEDLVELCAMDATRERFAIEALHFPWLSNTPDSLPLVLANMKKLRWISWSRYPATSLPRNFQPTKLSYLSLPGSLMEQLWEGYKQHLPSLKVLNLYDSRKLIRTPDFEGLPCLERLILNSCTKLREIHPSVGYHDKLIFLDMRGCKSLKLFPPIVRMKKLETLILSECSRLRKFPDIQTNMDNLVELSLKQTGIEVVPSSVGRYCTNLISLDLSDCKRLLSITGNFRHLQHLERIYLNGNDQLNIPTEGLFDVKCCLKVLSLYQTPFKKFHQGMVSMKLLGFSHSLLRLNLSSCNLVDGDIFSLLFEELSNLQVLDLQRNKFSRLHSNLLLLPRLKYLNLSRCKNLVELPDLPSSIAILIAERCDSLEVVGLPTKLKWLWKLSLSGKTKIQSILQSMLKGNAVEEYFIILNFLGTSISIEDFAWKSFVLELPCNYYNEFSGFLITVAHSKESMDHQLVIKDESNWENEDDVPEVLSDSSFSDYETTDLEDDGPILCIKETIEEYKDRYQGVFMCYISFGSLRSTTWWNSTRTKISFSIKSVYLKVELVPRRSKGDSTERLKDATDLSEFWDREDEYHKSLKILGYSRSRLFIKWYHNHDINLDYMYQCI